jgi:hypothetical protein
MVCLCWIFVANQELKFAICFYHRQQNMYIFLLSFFSCPTTIERGGVILVLNEKGISSFELISLTVL